MLNARQKARLEAVFADENHIAIEICWGFYQRMLAAYAHPVGRRGKTMMTTTNMRYAVVSLTLWRNWLNSAAFYGAASSWSADEGFEAVTL